MSKNLIKVEEVYRADTESEAAQIIDEAKKDNRFVLSKYSSVKKAKKAKGEIVDEWMKVSLTKTFDDEQDPISNVEITYSVTDDFKVL